MAIIPFFIQNKTKHNSIVLYHWWLCVLILPLNYSTSMIYTGKEVKNTAHIFHTIIQYFIKKKHKEKIAQENGWKVKSTENITGMHIC